MNTIQSGILYEVPRLARFLSFSVDSANDVPAAMQALAEQLNPEQTVVGLGQSLVQLTGKAVDGLSIFPAQTSGGIEVPSTPAALWCWLRGDDRGELYHRSRTIQNLLEPAFVLVDAVDSFQYNDSRDMSGYVDGTENPEGDEAIMAAIVQDAGTGMNGSSFVAVQQWLHDFDALDAMTTAQRDDVIGRHIADNEEFDEAPESAHVKRAAQESFDPEAFILRRSMPWADGMEAGLVFVAFGKSYDAFETILNRMLGNEDGITDGLFSFTRPVTGAYYWCPPVKDGKLDLSILGL